MAFYPGMFRSRIMITPIPRYFWGMVGRLQNYYFRPAQHKYQKHRERKAFQ